MAKRKGSISLSLNVSPELNSALEKMAEDTHATKSEILKDAREKRKVWVLLWGAIK